MKNQLDEHLAAYQGNGNVYDFDNEILLKWYPARVAERCSDRESLLELGLGHGYTTELFSKQFKRHLVLDGSPAIIERFREKFPHCNSEILETYFEEFESEEQFQVIVMGFILEHVDDPLVILKKYRNKLKAGGKLYVAVPNAAVMNRRLGNLAGMLDDMEELSEHDHLLGHKRYYTVDTLTSDANAAGYEVTHIEGIYLKPLTTNQMLSLNLSEDVIDALCKLGISYPELSCAILAELELS